MQVIKFASILAAAALANANSILFKSQDDVDRTVYFTPNAGMPEIKAVQVGGNKSLKVEIPWGWIGNFYSVSRGASNAPGMLGEVAFNGWNGITFFDVSAIVNPNDHVGVKQMWPANGRAPTSGCFRFPCNNAYYVWDDVQTKATQETDLICTLGQGSVDPLLATRESEPETPSFKRDFVEGKWTR